jgi:hypothetical protein
METVFPQNLAASKKIRMQKRFAARNRHGYLIGVVDVFEGQYCLEEIIKRHILIFRMSNAVATAMTALQIATLGTFPKEIA